MSTDMEVFRAVGGAGLTLIPLKGKAPVQKGWVDRAYINADTLRQAKSTGCNLGVRLTDEHLVIDVDPRNGGEESLARLSSAIGIALADWTPATRTGSGGLHLWMKKPAGLDVQGKLKDFPGIDLKTKGGQVVAPGSVHPDTKALYVLDDPFDELSALPDLPHKLSDLIRKPSTRAERAEAPRGRSGSPGDAPDTDLKDGWGVADPAEITDLLAKLDPKDFRGEAAWFPLLCAVHFASGGAARSEFLGWSARDPLYSDDMDKAAARWDSLGRKAGSSSTGTLMMILREHGAVDTGFRFSAEREAEMEDFASDDPDLRPEHRADMAEAANANEVGHEHSAEKVLERMARKFIAILNFGKFEIWMRDYDPSLKRHFWQAISKQHFLDYFQDEKVEVGRKLVSKAELFLNSRNKKKFRGVVFDPRDADTSKGKLNLWEGWAVKPAPGDWSLLHELIMEVLCGGVQEYGEYVLNWIANMFQKPWKVAGSSIVFRGEEGTGKGTLGRVLMQISGTHGLTVASVGQVTGRFNAHLRNCVFLFSDEVNWNGSKASEGALKALITEPIIQYEGKHKDAGNAPNLIHMMLATNEVWAVPAGETARRFFVSDVSSDRKGDKAFFDAVDAQMHAGGYAAFLHDMLNRDLSDWHPGAIPNTQALAEQKLLSLTPAVKFWKHLLTGGDLSHLFHFGAADEPDDWDGGVIVLDAKMKNRLVLDFQSFLQRDKLSGNATHAALAREGRKFGLDPATKDTRGNRTWTLPPLADMRAAFEEHFKASPGSVFD